MRGVIEVLAVLIAAALGAVISFSFLCLIAFASLPTSDNAVMLMDGAWVWTATIVVATVFWPFAAAAGLARLIAGIFDQSRSWKRTGVYAAGLAAVVAASVGLRPNVDWALAIFGSAVVGAGLSGILATLMVNRATDPRLR